MHEKSFITSGPDRKLLMTLYLDTVPTLENTSVLTLNSLINNSVPDKINHVEFQPHHEKIGFLYMREQRRRSAAQ